MVPPEAEIDVEGEKLNGFPVRSLVVQILIEGPAYDPNAQFSVYV